jgi:hypothetical protein
MRSVIASVRAQYCKPASSLDQAEVQLDGVALLRWPEDHAARAALERSQRPRLLLVAQGAVPPLGFDVLEDWTRAEPGSAEVHARVAALSRRSRSLTHDIRQSGRHLHRGAGHVTMTPAQCVTIAPLVRLAGHPVPRAVIAEELTVAGTTPSPAAVRSLLVRLDRAVAPLGLRVWLLNADAVMLEILPIS